MRHNGVNGSESSAGPLAVTRLDSPVGPLTAVATDHALVMLAFADPAKDAIALAKLAVLYRHAGDTSAGDGLAGGDATAGDATAGGTTAGGAGRHAVLGRVGEQLAEYFAGRRRAFDLPLVPSPQPFARSAWAALAAIPYGQTRSYRQQAEAIGRPTAVRAVARANAANRVVIVLPCHRVIGSDGTLTGFGGGLARKRWLLDHERRHAGGT